MTCANLENLKDIGLLILRVGLGSMFIFHGLPKMLSGPKMWHDVGMAINNVGISFAPTFWGFCSAFSELIGGILIILGLFFRPACTLLAINLAVATTMHLKKGDGLATASHAIEDGIVFLSLILIGPGKYSLDRILGLL